jgi:probable O-glycosylation ligase (exosortase A-associated)
MNAIAFKNIDQPVVAQKVQLSKLQKSQSSIVVYYTLLVFIFTEFMGLAPRFPLLRLFHINTLVPIGGLFLFILNVFLKRQNLIIARQGWLFILLLFLILFSFLHAYWTFIVFETFKLVSGYIFIYFLIINHLDSIQRFRNFIWVFIIAHGILVLTNFHALMDVQRRSRMEAGPFLTNGNDFALALTLILSLALCFLFYERKRMLKILLFVMISIFIFGIFMTQSRGGILAFFITILFIVFNSRYKIYGLLLVILTTVILYFALPYAFERLKSIENYQEEASARSRIDAWKASLKMVSDHPLTGVGAGNFTVAYGLFYRPENALHQYAWFAAHSIYFEILGELGLPGIMFLFLVLFFNFWDNFMSFTMIKMKRELEVFQKIPVYLSAVFVSFMVCGAFLSCISYPHLYMYSGIVVACRRIIRQSIIQDENS